MHQTTDDGIASPEQRRHGKQQGGRQGHSGMHKAGVQFGCAGGNVIKCAVCPGFARGWSHMQKR